MLFTKQNNVNIHYQMIAGPADKPVVVFVNSLGTDFRIWRDVLVQLAGDYPLVVYDKRGHGLSDIGATPYSLVDHVDDLASLLDHLNVSNAVICGLSVGGMIAQQLHAKRLDLIKALVLCDTAHKIGSSAMWDARIRDVLDNGLASISLSVMERWFTEKFRRPENASYAGYTNMLVRQPAEGYAATCAAIRDADLTEITKMIDVPTLCIVGTEDGATPPDLVKSMSDLIEGSHFELINDAGHIPCVEQPEAFIHVLKSFLAKI